MSHLRDRLFRLVGQDQCLVVYLGDGLLMSRLQNRSGWIFTELRINRPQYGVPGHDDFIRGERKQGAARHGVMRDKHCDVAFACENRARNLRCRQNQTARRVQHQIYGNLGIGQVNGSKYLFAIVDVNVTEYRKAEQAHRLLPVHEKNEARFSFALDQSDHALAGCFEQFLFDDRLKGREHEKQPNNIHSDSFRLTSSLLPSPFEPVFIRLQLPASTRKQATQEHSTYESAHVRPPRDTTDFLRTGQRRCAAKQINKEPEDKIKYGWNLEKEREKEEWKQNNESRRRKEHQVRTEHTRDRARSAYRWKRRIRNCQTLRETGSASTDQIENGKSGRSHSVLDVVAENPERPHVDNEVKPAAM